MALGIAFYRWASVGMLGGILAVPAWEHRSIDGVREQAALPWLEQSMDLGFTDINLVTARGVAYQAILYAQGADRYRLAAGSRGPVTFANYDVESTMQDIGRVSCEISSDDKTSCVVSAHDGIPSALLASQINDLFGRDVAGIHQSGVLIAPSGSTITLPIGITYTDSDLLIILD